MQKITTAIRKFTALTFIMAMACTTNAFAVSVNGFISLDEGYDEFYNVTFSVEKGPANVTGGKLYIKETATKLYVGMSAPLTINDNTYAPYSRQDASNDARADDWGNIKHTLSKLERSDKWEVKIKNFQGHNRLEINFDYIDEDQGQWNARIEKFKLGSNLDKSLITMKTSLDYNYNELNMTSFFTNKYSSSSPTASDGFYDYDNPNQAWLSEIAYEFMIDKNAIPNFEFTSQAFREIIFANSIFHMSPNKLGRNKVYVNDVTETRAPQPPIVPLPAASYVGLQLLAAIIIKKSIRKRRNP